MRWIECLFLLGDSSSCWWWKDNYHEWLHLGQSSPRRKVHRRNRFQPSQAGSEDQQVPWLFWSQQKGSLVGELFSNATKIWKKRILFSSGHLPTSRRECGSSQEVGNNNLIKEIYQIFSFRMNRENFSKLYIVKMPNSFCGIGAMMLNHPKNVSWWLAYNFILH